MLPRGNCNSEEYGKPETAHRERIARLLDASLDTRQVDVRDLSRILEMAKIVFEPADTRDVSLLVGEIDEAERKVE